MSNTATVHLQVMRCGACGGDSFSLYRNARDGSLMSKCRKCESTSVIRVSQPKLEIAWGESSEGILTVFPDDS